MSRAGGRQALSSRPLAMSASPASRFARSLSMALVALLVPSSGCEERTGTFCECPPAALVVRAPEGTTFEVTGGACTGRCRSARGLACGDFLVESASNTECTVRATRPGITTQDSLFVTFTERGCCGLLPDQLEWTPGQKVDPEG